VESNARTTSSTAGPRASSDEDWSGKPAIPSLPIPGPRQPSGLAPRPAPPKQQLTARPLAHDIDWDHIPSAGRAPVPAYDDAWGRPSAWVAFGSAA
jgi:hypothetical protein